MVSTSTQPSRLPTKSPKYSIIWSNGWSDIEIVDTSKGIESLSNKFLYFRENCEILIFAVHVSTGRLANTNLTSRLCKRRIFERFVRLVSKNGSWRTAIEDYIHNDFAMYGSVKRGARNFGEAKNKLEVAFVSAKLGKWITKPLEQSCFELHVMPSNQNVVYDGDDEYFAF